MTVVDHRKQILISLCFLTIFNLTVTNGLDIFAQAETPLKGSATKYQDPINELPLPTGPAYYPKDRASLQADADAKAHRFNAAKKQYQVMLKNNPHSAVAHNGLGKLAYWQTSSSNQTIRDQQDVLYNEAIQHFLTALRFQPNYVEARLNLGTVYMAQGRLNDAHEEFYRAYHLAPKNSDVLEKMGVVALRDKRLDDASQFLSQAVSADPSNASARYYQGVLAAQYGDNNQAYKHLNDSLAINKNNALPHHQLGVVLARQGNGGAAVAEFQKALRLDPEYKQAGQDLATHYQNRGDRSLALAELKNQSESHSDDQALLEKIARLSLVNRQPDVAATYYQKLLQQNPANRTAREGLSKANLAMAEQHLKTDRLMSDWQAQQHLQSALKQNPDNVDARLHQVALTNNYHHPLDVSRDEVVAVLSKTPVTMGDHLTRGEVYLDRYRFNQARQSFQQAIQLSSSVEESVALGETLLAMGLPNMAQQAFKRVTVQQPGHTVAVMGAKRAAQASQQAQWLYDRARNNHRHWGFGTHHQYHHTSKEALFQKALSLNVGHAGAHYRLARLYEHENRYGQAADHYFAYLALSPAAKDRQRVERRIQKLAQKLVRSGS